MSFLFFHLWLPPQTFSNSSIAICFVRAFSEFFVIILFFLIVILLFLSCRSGARCSDWHVQRYGRFLNCARFRATFAIGCCDSRTISRQPAAKALWRVASSYLLILQVDFFQITGDRHTIIGFPTKKHANYCHIQIFFLFLHLLISRKLTNRINLKTNRLQAIWRNWLCYWPCYSRYWVLRDMP